MTFEITSKLMDMENDMNMTPAPEELLGTVIDGFRLESVLGCGSYGVVYFAWHEVMERGFALKILQAEFSSEDLFVKEFFHECKTAAKLEHPNVVQAFQAGSTPEGLYFFVMEYVEGSTVEELRINSPELLSLKFLLELFIQLADALDYAWKTHGIVHRDIKPGNLLVRAADGQLKLADLGLAGVGSSSSEDEIVATPLYMAPEVASGETRGDIASDIYSFGVMFYELIAGTPPFTGSVEELQMAHLKTLPEPLFSVNPDMDLELARYIDSMLLKDPAARPADWGEIRETLKDFKERLFSAASQTPVLDDSTRKAVLTREERRFGRESYTFIIAAAVAVLLLLLVFLFLFF